MIFVHSKSKFSLKRWIGRGKNAWLKRPKKAYFLQLWKVSIKSTIKKLVKTPYEGFPVFIFSFYWSNLLDQAFKVCHFLPVLAGGIYSMFAVYLLMYLPLHGELYKGFSTFLISMSLLNSLQHLTNDILFVPEKHSGQHEKNYTTHQKIFWETPQPFKIDLGHIICLFVIKKVLRFVWKFSTSN